MDSQDSEIDEETTNEYNQEKDYVPANEDDGISEAEEKNQSNLQRGRGRPRFERTGKPGRPKKIYQRRNDTNHDPVDVAEAMNRSDRSA